MTGRQRKGRRRVASLPSKEGKKNRWQFWWWARWRLIQSRRPLEKEIEYSEARRRTSASPLLFLPVSGSSPSLGMTSARKRKRCFWIAKLIFRIWNVFRAGAFTGAENTALI